MQTTWPKFTIKYCKSFTANIKGFLLFLKSYLEMKRKGTKDEGKLHTRNDEGKHVLKKLTKNPFINKTKNNKTAQLKKNRLQNQKLSDRITDNVAGTKHSRGKHKKSLKAKKAARGGLDISSRDEEGTPIVIHAVINPSGVVDISVRTPEDIEKSSPKEEVDLKTLNKSTVLVSTPQQAPVVVKSLNGGMLQPVTVKTKEKPLYLAAGTKPSQEDLNLPNKSVVKKLKKLTEAEKRPLALQADENKDRKLPIASKFKKFRQALQQPPEPDLPAKGNESNQEEKNVDMTGEPPETDKASGGEAQEAEHEEQPGTGGEGIANDDQDNNEKDKENAGTQGQDEKAGNHHGLRMPLGSRFKNFGKKLEEEEDNVDKKGEPSGTNNVSDDEARKAEQEEQPGTGGEDIAKDDQDNDANDEEKKPDEQENKEKDGTQGQDDKAGSHHALRMPLGSRFKNFGKKSVEKGEEKKEEEATDEGNTGGEGENQGENQEDKKKD